MVVAVRPESPSPHEHVVARIRDELRTADQRRARTIEHLSGRLALFERMYGCSTAAMMQQVDSGQIQETDELLLWRMEAFLLDRVTSS